MSPTRSAGRDSTGSAITHIPALDGLRGVAIGLVLAIHFGVAAEFPRHLPGQFSHWIERLFYLGWTGVDLFFVLSGFLITSILLASRDHPHYVRRFYGRRALRIFPLYLVALALGLFVLPLARPAEAPALLQDAAHNQVWLWTYTLNIANAFGLVANAGVLAQMWTLAIEEQFYAVWPWVVRRASLERLLALCGVVVVAALALRVAWIALDFPEGWQGAYRFTLTRLDALAAGAAIAVIARDATRMRRLATLAPTGLAIGGAVLFAWFLLAPRFYLDQPGVVTVGHSVLAITFACLVVISLGPAPPRWMCVRPLRALGKYSYGIYVWHWPVQYSMVLYSGGRLHPVAFVTVGVVVSLLLGLLSYWLIEKPFLNLKDWIRYEPRRDGAAMAETAG